MTEMIVSIKIDVEESSNRNLVVYLIYQLGRSNVLPSTICRQIDLFNFSYYFLRERERERERQRDRENEEKRLISLALTINIQSFNTSHLLSHR